MNRSHVNSAVILLSLLLSAGCETSPPLKAEEPVNVPVAREHADTIAIHSAGNEEFSGLYNTFEVKATLLNSEVREALIKRQADYFQWDQSQLATERDKARQELSAEIGAFLSFSTPERKNDNLSDGKSIWRILLDAGGRRYVGRVKRDRRLTVELQALYPYHTRWNTPYLVTFPIAASAIETGPAKMTITGPLGSRVLEFRAVAGSGLISAPPSTTEPATTSTPATP